MKKNYLTLLAVLFSLSFIHCSDDEKDEVEEINPMNAFTPLLKPNIEYGNRIGYGYDFTATYINGRAIKKQVVDIEKYIEKYADRIMIDLPETYTSFSFEANQNWEYTKMMTEAASDYTDIPTLSGMYAFSGTILDNETLYKNEKDLSEYQYASAHVYFSRRRYFLGDDASSLLDYITDEFKDDLNKLTAEDLITKYGTHVLKEYTLGARIDFIYKTKIDKKEKDRFAQILEAGLRNTVVQQMGIWINGRIEIDRSDVKKNKTPVLFMENQGGNDNLCPSGTYNLQKQYPKFDINKWIESINETNEALIDLSLRRLIPLSDFISDTEKKTEVESAIKKYIQDRQIPPEIFYIPTLP